MAANDGDWWDYVSGGTGKAQKIKNQPLPIVAVTTTAGTGTEADPWTVITNGDEKIGGGGDKTFPTISVVDPDFMMTVPPHLTAYQGFDALFHACEGYIATIANPISEMFSLKSIELIGKSLAKAVADGSDKDARADVALANTHVGFCGDHVVLHLRALDRACAFGLPPESAAWRGPDHDSLEYYKLFTEVCAGKMVDMARALGKKDAAKPEDFVDALRELQAACKVDSLKLSDYGVDKDDFGKYADNARANMAACLATTHAN